MVRELRLRASDSEKQNNNGDDSCAENAIRAERGTFVSIIYHAGLLNGRAAVITCWRHIVLESARSRALESVRPHPSLVFLFVLLVSRSRESTFPYPPFFLYAQKSKAGLYHYGWVLE